MFNGGLNCLPLIDCNFSFRWFGNFEVYEALIVSKLSVNEIKLGRKVRHIHCKGKFHLKDYDIFANLTFVKTKLYA